MGHLNNVKKVFISVMFLSFFFLGNVYAAEKDLMCSEKNLLKIDLSPEDVRIFSEWDEHFSYILKQNLWSKTNIYDTGHYMMVPLHVAFFADDIKMIKDFSDQFHLFMKFLDGRSFASTGAGTQNNAQYIYMASDFLWL